MRYLKNKKPTLLHYCSHCSELLGQKQKREVQCVTPSRTRAIRATGCARWCAHCARIDFLWRPSWQIPSPRVEVPRDPLRKLSRNFKGSRLSAQLLLLRNAGWMDPKDISVTWTKNFEVNSPSWSFALLGKVDQGRNLLGFSLWDRAFRRGGSLQGKCLFIDVLSASRFSANKHLVKTVR